MKRGTRIASEIITFTDAVYHAVATNEWEVLRKTPATLVTQQTSWKTNRAARVRKTLEAMYPHDFKIVEGVEVRKYSHATTTTIIYTVNGECSQLTLSAAVMRVCEVVENRLTNDNRTV